jgi:phage repressor protein C with HTH and peptisase S24 domain
VLSHARIWAAIDRLAERNNMTPSGLARRAGLDPTTFNKSKRSAADGRLRWPSTESIAKILDATRTEIGSFLGWDQIPFPAVVGENVFALEVSGDSMLPLYRHGDTIIVARDTNCRKGDRVVVKTSDGEVMAKILNKRTQKAIDLASLNPSHKNRTIAVKDIEWMGRIIWASQ